MGKIIHLQLEHATLADVILVDRLKVLTATSICFINKTHFIVYVDIVEGKLWCF